MWRATSTRRSSAAASRSNSPSGSARPRCLRARAQRRRRGWVHGRLPGGVGKLERSLAAGLAEGHEEHAARGYTNLGSGAVRQYDYANADRHLSTGIAYCEQHDLDPVARVHEWLARQRAVRPGAVGRGRRLGRRGAAGPNVPVQSRIMPLVVLGRLRARRGNPRPWNCSMRHPGSPSERRLQRLAPVAAAHRGPLARRKWRLRRR